MNTPFSADERALFEAAYIDSLGHRIEDFDLHFNTDIGRYDDDDIQCGWWAWQHRASLGAAQVPSLGGTVRFDIPAKDCFVAEGEGGPYPMYRCMDCNVEDYGIAKIEHKPGCRVATALSQQEPTK